VKLKVFFLFFLLLLRCHGLSKKHYYQKKNSALDKFFSKNIFFLYEKIIKSSAEKYKIDENLIRSIIYVESKGNSLAVSRSNAIGLMQIKASAAGREVYRLKGRKDQPSKKDLSDPTKNIDIGTAYINMLQNQDLLGIHNKNTLRYAVIVAYVNGTSALLKTFSNNRKKAIIKINCMTPKEFFFHIKKNIQHHKLFYI
jgi:membrane-bound lytic murein transglycosylase E